MNFIDAVSPRFCATSRDLDDLLSEYGPYQGRYISNYPKSWKRELLEHLSDIKVIKLAAQKQLLNPYNENGIEPLLMDDSYPWQEGLTWTKNVEELQKNNKFNEVIGDVYDPAPFDIFENVIPRIKQNRKRSTTLHGRLGEYIHLIKPLLKKGPAAYLIDPYFQALSPSGESFISRIFENISKSNCFNVHIFTREVNALEKKSNRQKDKPKDFYSFKEYELLVKESLSKFNKGNKGFYLHLVDDKDKTPELHNRFFLTKYGGIDFGRGFDHFDYETAQISVYIVDREHHLNLVDWFINEKSKFKSEKVISI
jgi:hypothetical protein